MQCCGSRAQNYAWHRREAKQILKRRPRLLEPHSVLQHSVLPASGHSSAVSSTANASPRLQVPSSMQPAPLLGGAPTPCSALPSQRLSPTLSTPPARDSGGRLPCPLPQLDPQVHRLTGSASPDARPSSEAPGSGQCRLTSCRDNATVTSRTRVSPTSSADISLGGPILQAGDPRPERGSRSSKATQQVCGQGPDLNPAPPGSQAPRLH